MFGVLNIVFGCYYLVRGSPGLYKIVAGACKNPEKITGSEILVLLLLAVGIGLSIWLLVLGIGLLTMKRWARRGSCMYARIQIVLMVLGISYIAMSIKWSSVPEEMWGRYIFTILTMLANLTYPILLLIFMQSAKVKQAFSAIGG